ncbi:MAG TPA: DsbA family oxidoreductase, partial [Candidatus Baltobacteraceae bacterium]|nr:DsbA family oxidoreductase [Candidatus Baltobacteraceae bacterium]
IGVARFERALERFDGEVTVRLHPFQLDPEAPIPGVPARHRYAAKFGGEADAILARVTAAALEDGLHFDFDRALTANTFDAHRAIAFARSSGKDRMFEHRLFAAYFSEGLDVSDRSVLAQLGGEVGLEIDALAAYLAGDDGVDELRRELEDAFERGISAVPTFVFEEEFAVPGAVDTATFLRMLEQMRSFEGAR